MEKKNNRRKSDLVIMPPDKKAPTSLREFLNAITPVIVDRVATEAEAMEAEGEKFGFGSIQKLFNRVVPKELIQKIGNAQKNTKAIKDGKENG